MNSVSEPISLGFDLDGVLADTLPIIASAIWRDFRYDIGSPSEYIIDIPHLSQQDFKRYIQAIILNKSGIAKPYPEADGVLKYFSCFANDPIHIVTARHPSTHGTTKKWIKENLPGLQDYKIAFISSSDKARYLADNKVQCFVEDRRRTAWEVSLQIPKTFLIDRPWNRGHRNYERGTLRYYRIESLWEIIDLIHPAKS